MVAITLITRVTTVCAYGVFGKTNAFAYLIDIPYHASILLSVSVTLSWAIMSVLAVARVPLPFTIEKYAGSDIWILWVVDIMLNKQLMSALFITAQKALFAVPGCSVLLYLVASAMGAFHRRYYPYNPSLSLTMMLLRWRNRG